MYLVYGSSKRYRRSNGELIFCDVSCVLELNGGQGERKIEGVFLDIRDFNELTH